MPASFAHSLFGITKVGARVIITGEETEPRVFEHTKLFKPLPAETPQNTATIAMDTKVAANGQDPGIMAELPQFLGLTPALAEAARDPSAFTPARPRSRAEAERQIADRIDRLQLAMKTAEAQKVAASEKAKVAVRDAEAVTEMHASAKAIMIVHNNNLNWCNFRW